MKINRLLVILIVISVFSCKTGDSTPDWAGNYLGVYRTEASFGSKYSKYTWIISKEGHNQLRIGLLTEDAYQFGSSTINIRNFYSANARLRDKDSFEIDEEVTVADRKIKVKALVTKMENGWLAVKLPSIANEGEEEYLEFKKLQNLSNPKASDFTGTYETTTVDGNQTSNHKLVVSKREGNILKVDYSIEDFVVVGQNTLRGTSQYSLQSVAIGENNSLKIDELTGEANKRINIRASGLLVNMKYSDAYQPDVIAVGIQYTSPNGAEARKSDYLEFKKK